jgi:hypothetical protein
MSRLERIRSERAQIEAGIPYHFACEPYRKDWADARFEMPYPGTYHNLAGIRDACALMQTLVERTLPIVKAMPRTGSRLS